MIDRIQAPWTPQQVEALNHFQTSGWHPFTCGSAARCLQGHKAGDQTIYMTTTLVATEAGWVCPTCGYTQDWAYRQMMDGSLADKDGKIIGPAEMLASMPKDEEGRIVAT